MLTPRPMKLLLVWTVALALHSSPVFAQQAGVVVADVDPDHARKMAKGLELFQRTVRPVLAGKCLTCHGGDEVKSEFNLAAREGLLRGGKRGAAAVAGKPDASRLLRLIRREEEPHMPDRRAKLSDEEISAIASWIELGAPYDAPLVDNGEKARPWTEKTVSGQAREWWSFQPLRKPASPAVRGADWCRTDIDRFILERIEAKNLEPSPAADRRRLIRRLYFDLIGLPPPPEEVEAFEEDDSPAAYDLLIDRLLASPHYGERWGRHWLDVTRFAESHGFEHDYDRPSAYHFRDFAIQALNQDLPYDTFVRWQIAGDEYAPEDNLALMATGFLAAGVHSTQITKNEAEKHRYDEMDDMLATVGTSMLGLTIGCARCHDHKFDPIPQADYYRLVSSFTTTVRSEMERDMDPEGYRKARAAFDRAHEPFAARLGRFESEELPGRFKAWDESRPAADASRGDGSPADEPAPWVLLDLTGRQSKGGATLTVQEDGSLLAEGNNPPHETFTFTAETDLRGITAVRIEALAHPSLAKGGPGRAQNGNFALTEFKLSAAPKVAEKSPAVAVKFARARATFEQKGLPVAAAIDGKADTAWAVDPELGKDHAAVFELEEDLGFEGGTALTFTLVFTSNANHSIARPRLSVTAAPRPAQINGASIAAAVRAALRKSSRERSEAESAALLKWFRERDSVWRDLSRAAAEHMKLAPRQDVAKMLVSTEGLAAVRLHTQGEDFLPETHFLRRGDPLHKEGVAPQGFLQVLVRAGEGEHRWQTKPPEGWRTSYRRRALADWLTDPAQGAGHLLARVIVNRIWQHHMGRGIVATPSDYGTRGAAPSHPELLDWLAARLIEGGWRLKPIHRLLLRSAVYRQSSFPDEAKAAVDRENQLFWRQESRRLEGEAIRDSIHAVAGLLDERLYGPGTLDEAQTRRSIYFTVKRSKQSSMMQVFDGPDALQGVPDRPVTTVAPQSLLLMNNEHIRGLARSFSRRLSLSDGAPLEDAVRAAYRIALGRAPATAELEECAAFLGRQMQSYRDENKSSAVELALADLCQALFCLNEFVYVE